MSPPALPIKARGRLRAEQTTALLPQGELVVIKGGIHATNYDSPATLAQIIRSFHT